MSASNRTSDYYDNYYNTHFSSLFREGNTTFSGCFLPTNFKKWQPKIYDLDVRTEDVWIVTFPKAGKLKFVLN